VIAQPGVHARVPGKLGMPQTSTGDGPRAQSQLRLKESTIPSMTVRLG
jgi:hypothetical protein